VGRALQVAQSALGVIGRRASLVDGAVAAALSALALTPLASSPGAGLALPASICALAATTSVAWRARAPEPALVVAGAGIAGYGWLAGSQFIFPGLVSLLLVMYSAAAAGAARHQVVRLVVLVVYGTGICILAVAGIGSLSASAVFEYALPLAFAAVSGFLVARQRRLAARLAAATERLRAEEQLRLAEITVRERNRVARELHDVVAHGVSVMVVQAGAARITVSAEPDLARAALAEVAVAGRTALAELRRITGVMADGAGPAPGIAGLAALVERRRTDGLAVRMSVTGGDPGLPAAVDATVYRLVQEALTNVVKHAAAAEVSVNIAIDPGSVDVAVANSLTGGPAGPLRAGPLTAGPPTAGPLTAGPLRAGPLNSGSAATGAAATGPAATGATGVGHGLLGMRERVESCGGRLSYGPRADGYFEVRARIPLPVSGQAASRPRGRGAALVIEWIRGYGLWPGVLAALVVLSLDAYASTDRRGPLALNVGLAAGMALLLPWRRRFPLGFLVAVNLLALPISNGLTSINNPTLVSTFVFAVPVWTVAAWLATGPAAAGLGLAAGFDAGEGLYWHFGIGSIVSNVLVAGLLWVAGRVVRAQRRLAADLERTHVLLQAEQEARESLRLSAERTRMAADLQSLAAERVSAMVAAAESVRGAIDADAVAATAAIGGIEQAGREALAALREILGLLRAGHDPEPLPALLGIEHLLDLVARYRGTGVRTELTVSGIPVPLLGGADVLAYRVLEEVLAAADLAAADRGGADRMAACRSVGLHFGRDRLAIQFALSRPLGGWERAAVHQQIQRLGGRTTRTAVGAGERITVELPVATALAGP
jgi:signal transduction histidine kinase